MAQTKVKKGLIDASFGTDWIETIQTSNFTAVAGKGYFVNTTSAEITVTLPVGVVGAEIVIQDYAGTFATNKVIFASNSSEKIQGSTDDFECTTNNAKVTLIYQDATKGWTADNISAFAATILVTYLAVAGGGAGGNGLGAGGGAGGLIHNYGGSSLAITEATNYVVTIGAGGAGTSSNIRVNGSDSIFNTLTSIGGGGGHSLQMQRNANILDGNPGGSGGGSGASDAGDGYGGAGTQSTSASGGFGNPGGNNLGSKPGTHPSAGGGGAGGAGASTTSSTQSTGGAGGVGLQVNIDGNNYYWAGGGGGSMYSGTNLQGGPGGIGGGGGGAVRTGTGVAGGIGGGSAINNGGNGFAGNDSRGGNGGNNTGSGGGGATWTIAAGGNGGSGIVILRYPSSYTITVPGGLTAATTTVSTDKVTTFTAGTGNIQFN